MGLHLWGKSVYSKAIILEVNISDKTCSHARAIKRHKQIRRSWLIISVSLQMVHGKAYTFKDEKAARCAQGNVNVLSFPALPAKLFCFSLFISSVCLFVYLSYPSLLVCLPNPGLNRCQRANNAGQRNTLWCRLFNERKVFTSLI